MTKSPRDRQFSLTASRVVGGLRHADAKIAAVVAIEVELETYSAGGSSVGVVSVEADVGFCSCYGKEGMISLRAQQSASIVSRGEDVFDTASI